MFAAERKTYSISILTRLGLVFVMLAFMSMPFSATGISLSLVLAAFCSLLANGPKNIAKYWEKDRTIYFLLALSLVMFIAVFYNSFNNAFAWHELKKYVVNFLLALAILPVFIEEKFRRWILSWIVVVAFFTSIFWAVCLHFSIDVLFGKTVLAQIISKIPWSYFLAFSTFILAHQICEYPQRRVVKYLLLLWFLYCLFYINSERSGMLITFILAGVLAFQRLNTRYALLAVFALPVAAVAIYFTSPIVHYRVNKGLHNIQSFEKGDLETSWGLRLAFAENSFRLIKNKPMFGYGMGAFPYAYQTTGGPTLPGPGGFLGDPHNTYLHLWVDIGFVGLTLFVLFLLSLWLQARKLPLLERFLIQGLVISFSVMCCLVSALLRQRILIFFLLLMVIGIASSSTRKKLLPEGQP